MKLHTVPSRLSKGTERIQTYVVTDGLCGRNVGVIWLNTLFSVRGDLIEGKYYFGTCTRSGSTSIDPKVEPVAECAGCLAAISTLLIKKVHRPLGKAQLAATFNATR